ncbi:MAG: hypothetical protein Q8O67_33685 [Deltaproteobacteria bacterium]|nr:hypothetical protein [Deltaproteobacteria bacterium]
MSVVVVPCLPVARPHLREAWRSLVGQGHSQEALGPVDDDTGYGVSGLLWMARALPLVIDVLAALEIADVHFGPAVVDVIAPGNPALARGPISMIGWRRDDELLVEVIVVPTPALEEASRATLADAALLRLAFPFRVGALPESGSLEGDDTDNMKIDVRVRRFSLGRT